MPEVRLIDAVELIQNHCGACANKEFCAEESCPYYEIRRRIETAPTIEAEPVKRGYWIECDYKHLEHGMLETEPNAGLCCSNCRTAFQKKKMTFKQYCAACGARMDAADTNVLTKDGGTENG